MRTKGGRPKKLKRKGGRPKYVLNVEDIMFLDESKPILPSIEKAVSHAIAIKMKQSLLPNKSIKIDTGDSGGFRGGGGAMPPGLALFIL